jgi:hypothetical protein
VVGEIRTSATARRALELCTEEQQLAVGRALCRRAAGHLAAYAHRPGERPIDVRTHLVDFGGTLLASSAPLEEPCPLAIPTTCGR